MKFSLLVISLFSFLSFGKTFSVMTYNLENLFDTSHDKGKEDYTYLPLKLKKTSQVIKDYCNALKNPHYKKSCLNYDWSEEAYAAKLENLSKVISSYGNGQGADILVLSEIENEQALYDLAILGLEGKGYKYGSLIEGPDKRGIDVAVISKYPIVSDKYHTVDVSRYSDRPTRGILEAVVKIGKTKISVFANHWPSQRNDDGMRMMAAKTLLNASLESKSDMVIAAGDFNTVPDDELNGIEEYLLPYFIDVEEKGRVKSRYKNSLKGGTHWYKGHWNSLDRIFVLKDRGNYKIDYSSFNIIAHNYMLHTTLFKNKNTGEEFVNKGIPFRFNPKTLKGFSDHLPMVIKIKI